MSSEIGVSGTNSAATATESAVNTRTKNTVKVMSHEHYLVPTRINKSEYFRCITCSTIYCQLCGKPQCKCDSKSPQFR
jgi:hypothetical protein